MAEAGTVAEPATLTADEKFERLLEVLAQQRAGGGMDPETLQKILEANAGAVQKAMRPENSQHPGISCFSHPEGDQKHPKPPLPYQLFWCGYPVHKFPETETWREWELSAQLQPGEYTVIRKDGSKMTVTARGERDADGQVIKLEVSHPMTREDKHLVPPKTVVMWQMIHPDNPRARFVEAMQEHLHLVLSQGA